MADPIPKTFLGYILIIVLLSSRSVRSFQPLGWTTKRTRPSTFLYSAGDWISLSEDNAVQKQVLEEGSGAQVAQPGQTVEIDYIGTLGEIDWDVKGVIECWLAEQQGLEGLADGFREKKVDAAKLMDPTFFTEDFVAETFGLSNKIQIKKLVMASKRLAKAAGAYPAGYQFDANKEGDPFTFVVGTKKVIRGMELAVASMKEGEHAAIVCRSDYAYGKEGYRKANGDVMVPEYATLCFDIKLLKCA